MKTPWNRQKPNTLHTMIGVLVLSVPAFWFLWYVMGTTAHRLCAVIALPLADLWVIFSYFFEKHADKKAASRKIEYLSGEYYRDPQWREQYLRYSMEHGFEACHEKGARWDMLRRYRRKSVPVTMMCMMCLLLAGTIFAMIYRFDPVFLPGIPLFGGLFWLYLREFIGLPVRKWLRQYRDDPELAAWLKSWETGRILSYQTTGVAGGICLNRPYIVLYGRKDVHTVHIDAAESMTREIVRVKTYQNSAYAGDKYRFYAVLHIRTGEGKFTLKTELNEYQLEMAVEEFGRIKHMSQTSQPQVQEAFTNEIVTP